MSCSVLSIEVAEDRLQVSLQVDGRLQALSVLCGGEPWPALAEWLASRKVEGAYARLRADHADFGRALELARRLQGDGHAVGLVAAPMRSRHRRPEPFTHHRGGASNP